MYRFSDRWSEPFDRSLDSESTVVLMFGAIDREKALDAALQEVCEAYPLAIKAGCSGAGEIFDDELFEHSLVVAVVRLEKSRVKKVAFPIDSPDESKRIGAELARSLMKEKELKAVLVLSEGLTINGSELTRGINSVLPRDIVVTGGLAGDDDRFEKTFVVDDQCSALPRMVSAIGFYGDHFRIASGYQGGWDRFGIEREITSSKKNVLYTLNNEPALEVYKRYLGKHADELPASALLFPLAIRESKESAETKVRTVLAVSEEDQSITFAGDMPEGGFATFMKANFDRLIDGAYEAAETMAEGQTVTMDALSIAISCVGRKLLLKQRTEEELEAALDVLPKGVRQIGFYSYGEISPMHSGMCDLHNQTMTLTLLWEA
ncbi:FIST signal transduction protein [Hydrogenimonas urashimensis]|uniref:FIST signal transduction protein n=1 Tax=Hydrogenimonas urashimensis TaxID=2740515 RepID=UPI001914F96D|nr:FIST N-terminal domain-containing protein [Hydrogenimonas urashimensis]